MDIEIDTGTMTTALCGVGAALLVYYLLIGEKSRYPPGPASLPLIGNLHQIVMSGSLYKFMETYRKKFGNVYTFEFGGNKRVIVSGYETIRDLLIKHADNTSNRSTASMPRSMQELFKKTPGLIWAPFPQWKTLRSFAITTLREDGMGKSSLEPQVMEEIDQYLEHFVNPNLGRPIEMKTSLSQATSNIISQMIYSRRFEYDDEGFNRMISAVNEGLSITSKVARVGNLPLGKYFVGSAIQRQKYLNETIMIPTVQSYIAECRSSLDVSNPRNLTDRYLIHSKQEKEEDNNSCFSDENSTMVGIHLYIAGTETTATTLRWALLFMCLYPEVKEKVQTELDEQIGPDRPVSCQDRVNIPYTDAVLLETFRKGCIASTLLPHTLENDMVIDGKLVPAGADMMINIKSVLYDEAVFEEPEKFKPERYLSGDVTLKKQRTIPFGIGRRACPGEGLARMEFFMFFVTFLQKYDVNLPTDSKVTDEPLDVLISSPASYDIIFTSRHE